MLTIISYMWDKNKQALIGILPAIGMVGTFIGIVYSLQSIDFNNIKEATPQILNGMGVAFITSIIGTGSSILIRMNLVNSESELPESATINTIADLLIKGNEETVSLKETIKNKNDELITEFKTFAEKQAENNTNALIDALKEVMRDFNAKINEQFGDNFKQLNEAVGRLLTWQENYYSQIELISENIKQTSELFEKNGEIILEVSDKYTNAIEISSKFEKAIDCFDEQREALESDMEKFSELTEKSKDIFPSIEENIIGLTDKLSEAITQSSGEMVNIVASQKDQMEDNITSLNQTYERSLNEINSLQSKIIDNLKSSITEIDKGLKDELNKSLNSLGQQLTALSGKFVTDYKPLTEKLQKLIKISEGVNDIHGQS